MDYKEKLKSIINSKKTPYVDINTLLKYFPELELKESEDNRIKNEIIQFLQLPHPQFVGNRNYEKWIAWLEKQVEQKPAKNIVETWKEMRLEVYQQASGNRHESNYSDDTTKMFSLNDIDEIVEKMSEQKPTDKVETNLLTVERAKEMSPFMRTGFENESAWSEEDETIKNNISHIIEQYDKISKKENQPCWYIGDCLLWMQNIKDRVLPQNIAYYNPYKEVVESIAEMCKHYDKANHSGLRDFYDNVKVKCKDAKEYDSLFPQNTWKPSDEQMEILKELVEENNQRYFYTILKSLYERLKKLKNE